MQGIVGAALIGACSVLVATIWLRSVNLSIQRETNQKNTALAATPAYKGFTLVVAVLALISLIAIIKQGSSDLTEAIVFYSFAVGITLLATRMTNDAFLIKAKHNDQGPQNIYPGGSSFLGKEC